MLLQKLFFQSIINNYLKYRKSNLNGTQMMIMKLGKMINFDIREYNNYRKSGRVQEKKEKIEFNEKMALKSLQNCTPR